MKLYLQQLDYLYIMEKKHIIEFEQAEGMTSSEASAATLEAPSASTSTQSSAAKVDMRAKFRYIPDRVSILSEALRNSVTGMV